MRYKLFAIFDRISGLYGTVTPFVNRPSAQRWFRSVIKQNELAQPTDFELYEVGEYDSSSGCVFGLDKITFIEKGVVEDET